MHNTTDICVVHVTFELRRFYFLCTVCYCWYWSY